MKKKRTNAAPFAEFVARSSARILALSSLRVARHKFLLRPVSEKKNSKTATRRSSTQGRSEMPLVLRVGEFGQFEFDGKGLLQAVDPFGRWCLLLLRTAEPEFDTVTALGVGERDQD